MILDRLENYTNYLGEHQALRHAFAHLAQLAANPTPAVGRSETAEDGTYFMVQQYQTKAIQQGFWESHREYIDIHYMVAGHERIGFANRNSLITAEYHPEKDFQAYDEARSVMYNVLDVLPGQFVLFYPEDVHMPGLFGSDGAQEVTKIVFKVKVSK